MPNSTKHTNATNAGNVAHVGIWMRQASQIVVLWALMIVEFWRCLAPCRSCIEEIKPGPPQCAGLGPRVGWALLISAGIGFGGAGGQLASDLEVYVFVLS